MRPMKIGEAAAYLGMHVRTLQRLDNEGTLKAMRTGTGRRYYTEAQLAAFLGIRATKKKGGGR